MENTTASQAEVNVWAPRLAWAPNGCKTLSIPPVIRPYITVTPMDAPVTKTDASFIEVSR